MTSGPSSLHLQGLTQRAPGPGAGWGGGDCSEKDRGLFVPGPLSRWSDCWNGQAGPLVTGPLIFKGNYFCGVVGRRLEPERFPLVQRGSPACCRELSAGWGVRGAAWSPRFRFPARRPGLPPCTRMGAPPDDCGPGFEAP